MTANTARNDGNKKKSKQRLSAEQTGVLQQRLQDVIRRVEEGKLSFDVVAQSLQRISEETFISHYKDKKPKETWEIFTRPPLAERRKSLSPYGMTLPHKVKRLEFPERNPERIMMELWEKENIPKPQINHGRVPVNAILNAVELLPQDVQIVAATVQWFGTNIGMSYLGEFSRAAELRGF